jgi:hypothetical protein
MLAFAVSGLLPFARIAARPPALALAVALLGACSESGPRIYTARLYRRAGCLEPYAALGLVRGRALGALCEPTCLRVDGELYVSSVCAPYPTRSSVEPPASTECAAALAAFAQDVTCEASDAAVTDESVVDDVARSDAAATTE